MPGQGGNPEAGVVGFAGVGLDGVNLPQTDPAFWTWAIFIAAVTFLVIVYFGFGGVSGSVKS